MTRNAARQRLLRAPILLSPAFIGALMAIASCGGGGAEPGPKAPLPQADWAPPPDCLTVIPCENYPCPAGAKWDLSSKLPSIAHETRYGSPGCPQYHILDIANSSTRAPKSVELHVAPLTQPLPCEKSEMHVFFYGHDASGWTQLPGTAQSVLPIQIQGQCALSDIRQGFGGMPEFDRFRVLSGGVTGAGAQLPLAIELTDTAR